MSHLLCRRVAAGWLGRVARLVFSAVFVAGLCAAPLAAHGPAPCVDGSAAIYPCDKIDLGKHLRLDLLDDASGIRGNDIWGWTDPESGDEIALMGLSNGLVFVDVTDPEAPVVLGKLPTASGNSTWRDMKVYDDHVFVVSESPSHGMQVFDLTRLRSVVTPPETFTADTIYTDISNTHNIVIDEDSGFAYAVGTNTCSAGLHMIDISTPTSPSFVGCFAADGYTHDAQCLTYDGPDTDHTGREICLASNTDTLTIIDVTDKSNPVQLSRTPYAGSAYTHQGWITEDGKYFLVNDELDEANFGHNTKTLVFDITDLDNVVLAGEHLHETTVVDHNLYILGDYVYEANYRAGLRILRLGDLSNAELEEVAFFDTEPGGGQGAWSVYPYFESGTVIVSDINQGLFVLRPQLCEEPAQPASLTASAAGDGQIDLSWSATAPPDGTYSLYRAFGTCSDGDDVDYQLIADGLTSTTYSDSVSGQVEYTYVVTASDSSGVCESDRSLCDSAQTTGACTAPPIFAGADDASSAGTESCGVTVDWSAATPNCGGGDPVTYAVFRGTSADFEPSAGNLVASGLTGTSWTDLDVIDGRRYHYVVRATDGSNGAQDDNLERVVAVPAGPLGNGTFDAGAEANDPVLITGSAFADPAAAASGGGIDKAAYRGQVVSRRPLLKAEKIVPFKHPQDGWETTDQQQFEGDRSYYSTHLDVSCLALTTQPLQLTAGTSPQLSFASIFDIEEGWDGGVVQISTDGNFWTTLQLGGAYPGSFINSGDACGFETGEPSFTGADETWDTYVEDLSAYAGQEVQIRWVYSTDQAVGGSGWWVDAIEITNVQVPSSCSTPGLIFADDFESSTASAWSSTSP